MRRAEVMRWGLAAVAALLTLAATATVCRADFAVVLPKGVWKLEVDYQNSFPIKNRFNENGEKEPIAHDFNTELDGNVFPDLVLSGLDNVTRALGLGPATLGKSNVTFTYELKKAEILLYYGVTDKLSVGVIVPYWWARNEVSAALDNTSTNLAINADFPSGIVPDPILPVGIPGVNYRPFTSQDIQDMLGDGLTVNGIKVTTGFGYKPVQTWSGNGVGDIEAGARYQYVHTEDWRLAVTAGMRFPTGKVDDPDSLVDYAFGDGAYAVLVRSNNDYQGIPNLLLNLTLKYDWILPTHKEVRVIDDPNLPLAPLSNKENVEIDMGDIFEMEAIAQYSFTKAFKGSVLYRFASKPQDSISGSKGLNYAALEANSNFKEQIFIGGFSYSTVPMYVEKKFPVPMTVGFYYKDRFAGENLLNSQYLIGTLEVYF